MKTKFLSLFILTILIFSSQFAWGQAAPAANTASGDLVIASPSADSPLYLPVVLGGGEVSGGGGGGGNTNAGALWLPFTLGDGSVLPTYGASVAVDSQGGIHVVYAIYIGTDEQGNRPATYAYCMTNCANKANWTYTRLGDAVQDARIALDPSGRPRIILFGPIYDPDWPRMRYQYAACDSGCTNSVNWTITTIVTPIETTATREYNNNRYFAVDSQGRPAFIYTDTNQNNHPGTFFMSCQANCTSANQWLETKLSSTLLDDPSLAFSPSGLPRLAFGFFDENIDLYLSYAQCDQDCTDPANWWGLALSQIHGTAKYNITVDSNGHPRMGFYSGSYAYNPFEDHQLYYLWCDSNCSTPSSWQFTNTGLPFGSGDGVDLALDHQNRPRMSFETSGQGLGYIWCNENCESGDGTWQSQEVEPQAALADNYEVLPIHRCTVSTWFNGQRSSLALDPSGNPRMAYDAQHWWYGTEYVGGVPTPCNYQDVTVTRISLMNQP